MPYVEGESLRERLRRERQLPLDDALRIAREVADALDYAHRQGSSTATSSRRTSCSSGEPCVLADFGIARALDGRRRAAHGDRDCAGHARLHESGAGQRRPPSRRAQRHLLARVRGVRDARGRAAVHRRRRRRRSSPGGWRIPCPTSARCVTSPGRSSAPSGEALARSPADRFADGGGDGGGVRTGHGRTGAEARRRRDARGRGGERCCRRAPGGARRGDVRGADAAAARRRARAPAGGRAGRGLHRPLSALGSGAAAGEPEPRPGERVLLPTG